MKRIAFLTVTILLVLFVTGCDNFERNTFKTLSASKAVLDDAQNKYEAGTQIPHNKCAFILINDGKAAQTTAVNAFLIYENIKNSKGDLATATATVTTDLIALAPLVVKVESLIANPAACKGA